MRKSRAEAAQTRRRIVEAAASAFGAGGIQETAVSDIMAAAGLSHGGFYRHFDSKDQLVTEACAEGMGGVVELVTSAADERLAPEALRAVVERYLSGNHVENRAGGCPLASLGSELARSSDATRSAATDGFLKLVEIFAAHYRKGGLDDARGRALFTVSALVGAVTMARIVPDAAVSADILQSAQRQLA